MAGGSATRGASARTSHCPGPPAARPAGCRCGTGAGLQGGAKRHEHFGLFRLMKSLQNRSASATSHMCSNVATHLPGQAAMRHRKAASLVADNVAVSHILYRRTTTIAVLFEFHVLSRRQMDRVQLMSHPRRSSRCRLRSYRGLHRAAAPAARCASLARLLPLSGRRCSRTPTQQWAALPLNDAQHSDLTSE